MIYVARSKTLSDWGSSVGISKNLFKVGAGEGSGKEAVETLCEETYAGVDDWRLVKADDKAEAEEDEVLERLEQTENVVDPRYYPRIKGAQGIIRIKPEKIEDAVLVDKALSGEESLNFKIKPADIANYLIKVARG